MSKVSGGLFKPDPNWTREELEQALHRVLRDGLWGDVYHLWRWVKDMREGTGFRGGATTTQMISDILSHYHPKWP
jgi:hypothetical protein